MKAETAAALQDAANTIGCECKTRDDYSGRSMYGARTHALVVGSMADVVTLAAVAGCAFGQSQEEDAVRQYEEFLADLGGLRQDGMGRDSIVVY